MNHCLKCIILFILLHSCATINNKNKRCQIDNEIGGCVPLNHCTPLYNKYNELRKTYRKTPISFLSELLKKHCDAGCCELQSFFPHVCCSHNTEIINKFNTVPVQNKANVLPENCGITQKLNYDTENAKLFEFPWMVLILYPLINISISKDVCCSGSIISNNYILTAAHCFLHKDYTKMTFRIGEYARSTNPDCIVTNNRKTICSPLHQDLQGKRVIIHPDYNNIAHVNDIALVQVPTIQFNEQNIAPICLPLNRTTFSSLYYHKLTFAFWERVSGTNTHELNNYEFTDVLHKLHQTIVPIDSCIKKYINNSVSRFNITAYNRFCAGLTGEKDSCRGNSGGPLISNEMQNNSGRYTQQGILSFGSTNCGSIDILPTVYTDLQPFIDWINKTIANS